MKKLWLIKRSLHTVYTKQKKWFRLAPIKKQKRLAAFVTHGVHNTAAGFYDTCCTCLRAVCTAHKVIHRPNGYFIAPEGEERIGDVSNVVLAAAGLRMMMASFYLLRFFRYAHARCHQHNQAVNRLCS